MADKLEKPATTTDLPASSSRDQVIDDWFRETMNNSPVSVQTHVYNHVRDAVAELKRRLAV